MAKKKFAYGANKPPSIGFIEMAAWHIVHEAKTREEIMVLAEAIAKVKLGELVIPIGTKLTFEEYLEAKQTEIKFAYGAMPPEDVAWQMGKTAASITFVHDAESHISTLIKSPVKPEQEIKALTAAITEIKEGRLVLSNWLSPKKYLESKGISKS